MRLGLESENQKNIRQTFNSNIKHAENNSSDEFQPIECKWAPPAKQHFSSKKIEVLRLLRLRKISTKFKNIIGFVYWHGYTNFAMGSETI